MSDDSVNHPAHYTQSLFTHSACGNPIEVIDITRHLNFDRGNAVKYVLRANYKGNLLEDLKKARWYLDDEIARVEAEMAEAGLGFEEAKKQVREDILNTFQVPAALLDGDDSTDVVSKSNDYDDDQWDWGRSNRTDWGVS